MGLNDWWQLVHVLVLSVFIDWSAECHMLFLYGYKYTYKD